MSFINFYVCCKWNEIKVVLIFHNGDDNDAFKVIRLEAFESFKQS